MDKRVFLLFHFLSPFPAYIFLWLAFFVLMSASILLRCILAFLRARQFVRPVFLLLGSSRRLAEWPVYWLYSVYYDEFTGLAQCFRSCKRDICWQSLLCQEMQNSIRHRALNHNLNGTEAEDFGCIDCEIITRAKSRIDEAVQIKNTQETFTMPYHSTQSSRFLVLLKRALLVAAAPLLAMSATSAFALTQVTSFGSNPGALNMYKYVPASMPSNAPLVVAMHGCTQSASAYEAAGWGKLADQYKFYVVYPEQTSSNNQNKCFNWFQTGDISRGQGEALSIKQMVDKMKTDYSIDPTRVYVTGLSAGGYMVNVMLATYPDVFAGGAPFSGGPYMCATTMNDAYTCMSPGVDKTGAAWGDLARSGYSGYTGRKPVVSIWHGDSDYTVKQMNQVEEMQQWTNYHGISETPAVSDTVAGYPHKVYKDASGNALVETYTITGMGHGTPVNPSGSGYQCGTAGAYILDVKICSSYYVAQFWGLTGSSSGTTTTTSSGTTSTAATTTSTTAASTTTTSSTTTTTAGACYNSSNYAHVTAGRAHDTGGYAYTNGSNQKMGLDNTFYTSKLRQTGSNYYVIDSTCP